MNRSSIPDIEPRPYYPQSQGKHERSHGKTKRRLDILNSVPGIIVL